MTVTDRIDAAERLYRALVAGNSRALLAAITPGFVGQVAEGMPNDLGGRYEGAEAMLRDCWQRLYADVEVRPIPEEILETCDGRIVVLGRYAGKARATGKPLWAAFAHVLRIDDGRVSELIQYTDTARWHESLTS
jgi:ketosteroid isomerase-like protein